MLNTMRFMVIGFVLIVTGSMLVAAPGDLDKTFNSDGYVTTDLGTSFENPAALAIDAQNRIVVAGMSLGRVVLMRYTPDGQLDTSFGTDGIAFDDLDLIDIGILPEDLVIAPDGKLIIVGNAQSDAAGYNRMFVARYNEDGSRDMTFGGGTGYVTPQHITWAYTVKVTSSGKIVVGAQHMALVDGYIWMLNSDGSVDTTFGNDGSTITPGILPVDMVLTTTDEILVTGQRRLNNNNFEDDDFALLKLTADGQFDSNFGTNGIVLTDFEQNYDTPVALVQDEAGRIVVLGLVTLYHNDIGLRYSHFGLVRYNPDGTLDTGFGTAGKVTSAFDHRGEIPSDLILQADQKLLVIGSASNYGVGDRTLIARYNPDGTLDTGFGINGYRVDNFWGFEAGILDNDQKLTVLVSRPNTLSQYSLARYETAGSLRTELLVNGSFEAAGATSKLPANWSATNMTKDVRKCNKPQSGKFLAFQGQCVMRFVGSNKEKSLLSQVIPGSMLNVGDRLNLNAWASFKGEQSYVTILAIVIYSNGLQDKIAISLSPIKNDTYEQFIAPVYKVTGVVSEVRVDVRGFNYAGKVLIDQVSLSKVAGNTSTIVIPDPAIPLP